MRMQLCWKESKGKMKPNSASRSTKKARAHLGICVFFSVSVSLRSLDDVLKVACNSSTFNIFQESYLPKASTQTRPTSNRGHTPSVQAGSIGSSLLEEGDCNERPNNESVRTCVVAFEMSFLNYHACSRVMMVLICRVSEPASVRLTPTNGQHGGVHISWYAGQWQFA